jgi:hypothetical protein
MPFVFNLSFFFGTARLSACARGGGARAEDTLRQRRAPAPARQAGRQDRVDALELGRGELGQRRNVATSTRPRVGARSVLGRASLVPSLERARRAETRKGRTSPIPQRTNVAKDTHHAKGANLLRISYEQRVCETSVKPTPKMPMQICQYFSKNRRPSHWMFKPKFNRYCCKSRQIGVRNHTDAHSHSHMKASHVNVLCVTYS